MREAWETWNATMPPIPIDATISLGYSARDMPQRRRRPALLRVCIQA